VKIFFRPLTALALLATGCASTADTEGYRLVACANLWSSHPRFDDLRPVAGLDAVQVRQVGDPYSPAAPASVALTSWGQACAAAGDGPACRATVEASLPSGGFHGSLFRNRYTYHFLLTTQGDEVRTHSTPEAVGEVLGTIDTEQEAVLAVYARTYSFLCHDVNQGGVRANPDGGFDVIAFRGSECDGKLDITQHVLHVSAEGEVRETESHVLSEGDPDCVSPARMESPSQ
jgi:hypothetical protein